MNVKWLTGLCLVGLLLIASSAAIAQTGESPDPPEIAEIKRILKLKSPTEIIAGLEEVLTDYPDLNPQLVGLINQTLLTAKLESAPEQTQKIAEYADKAVKNSSIEDRYETYLDVAKMLYESEVLLDKAEEYVSTGIKLLEETRARQLNAERSRQLLLLGRIYARQGKKDLAAKTLKQGHGLNPKSSEIAVELADLARNSGNNAEAFDYLIHAVLNGGITPRLRQNLEAVYKQLHNKPITELEKTLDAAYQKMYSSPIKVERYAASPSRTKRIVLAEIFTSTSCPPCIAADLSFDAVLQRYGRDEVAVLMYHYNAPTLDPMTNLSTEARAAYYSVDSTPTYMIDGKQAESGGDSNREEATSFYKSLTQRLEKRLVTQARADIKLNAFLQAGAVKVTTTVQAQSETPALKLHIVLVENMVHFSGESTIRFHPMVVRDVAGPKVTGPKFAGFTIKPLGSNTVEHTFDIANIEGDLKAASENYEKESEDSLIEKRYKIDRNNLSVVAFVQDERTKQILQAVYSQVTPMPAVAKQ